MKMSVRQRRALVWENRAFTVIIIVLAIVLLWFASTLTTRWDMTAGQANTLSPGSREVVMRLEGVVRVTAFVNSQPEVRNHIETLIERYRHQGAQVGLEIINPETDPDRARELNVTRNGEMFVEYAGKNKRILVPTEQNLTRALMQMQRAQRYWVAAITGHSQRRMDGKANHDWTNFASQLEKQGYAIRQVVFDQQAALPENARVAILASAREPFGKEQTKVITDYLAGGGNLLITIDPGEEHSVSTLLEYLKISVVPGVVVDPSAASEYRIENPAFIPVKNFANHPVSKSLGQVILLPRSCGLSIDNLMESDFVPLLQSGKSATVMAEGVMEEAGQLPLAIANQAEKGGRIVLVCDGDFLSNSFIGNGENLQFGLNIMNWLAGDDIMTEMVRPIRSDLNLALSKWQAAGIEVFFKFLLPVGLVFFGILYWRFRKRQ